MGPAKNLLSAASIDLERSGTIFLNEVILNLFSVLSDVLPAVIRPVIGTFPSYVTVIPKSTCLRSGLCSLLNPNATSGFSSPVSYSP